LMPVICKQQLILRRVTRLSGDVFAEAETVAQSF